MKAATLIRHFPWYVGAQEYSRTWSEGEKAVWGKASKDAVLSYFGWQNRDLPECWYKFAEFSIEELESCLHVLNDVKTLLPKSTDIDKIFPPYKRNPEEVLKILNTEWDDAEEIKDALAEVDYTMLKFLERHEIFDFSKEEDAIFAICGADASAEAICSFTRDPKTSKNIKREGTTEKKLLLLKKLFEKGSVVSPLYYI